MHSPLHLLATEVFNWVYCTEKVSSPLESCNTWWLRHFDRYQNKEWGTNSEFVTHVMVWVTEASIISHINACLSPSQFLLLPINASLTCPHSGYLTVGVPFLSCRLELNEKQPTCPEFLLQTV